MAFSSNDYQQLGLGDRAMALSERQKRRIDNSWAGAFASRIFPNIDDRLFLPLYSSASAKPSSPVNVLVGGLILEALFGLSDEKLVENCICDVRYQMALHTTSDLEQPISVSTLQRFRRRVADYERRAALISCVAALTALQRLWMG